MVELYQSGRSARYVAGEVGVSRTTVLNILIQSGVERRPVGPVPRAI
ncbi:helix-turn-helix domain-containing protein [Arachnia propionica]|nr:helix-turn-helix domain-containing protein [Arachnia propionica]